MDTANCLFEMPLPLLASIYIGYVCALKHVCFNGIWVQNRNKHAG